MALFQRFFCVTVALKLCFFISAGYASLGNFGMHQPINLEDSRFQLIQDQQLFLHGSRMVSDRLPLQVDSKIISFNYIDGLTFGMDAFTTTERDTVPDPRSVMRRSMILPGWGQYTNRQFWKIPIVYGLIGGLSYYAYFSHTRYTGYRAAFYNAQPENTDFRFGPTPAWVDPNAPPQFYRTSRDFFRNRRDFFIVTVVFAYILNFVDAYVYAHMRDFDVSDDLSYKITITPEPVLADRPHPGLRLNIRF